MVTLEKSVLAAIWIWWIELNNIKTLFGNISIFVKCICTFEELICNDFFVC